MECRDISERDFELIRSELLDPVCQVGEVDTVLGWHNRYGLTTLIRDGSRSMALVDNPECLDRFLAEQAFLRAGLAAKVTGRG